MRWDDESPIRFAFSVFALAVGGYVFATTEPSYYLHLPATVLIVLAIWGFLLAVVPRSRAERGTPHRWLIVVAEWAVFVAIVIVAGWAAVSS